MKDDYLKEEWTKSSMRIMAQEEGKWRGMRRFI
jgi:hypothetical protein